MRAAKMLVAAVLLLDMVVWPGELGKATPMGTVFTYQGWLTDANDPADGLYDLQFRLFDDPNIVDGNQVGPTIAIDEFDVVEGYFAAALDFYIEPNDPNIFTGQARWLEIGVRPGQLDDPNAYLALLPRQEIMPTPYALYALSGNPGPAGPKGDRPDHQWKWGSSLQFQKPDGTWGQAVNLGGPKGDPGDPGPQGPPGDSRWQLDGSDIYYNDGNVGIGTTNPPNRLSVFGGGGDGISVVDNSGNVMGLMGSSSTWGFLELHEPGGVGLGVLISPLSSYFAGGNVGIGTSNPSERLVVKVAGTSWSNPHFAIEASDSANKWDMRIGTNDKFYMGYNEDTKLVIDTSGRLGLGYASPRAKLDVRHSSSDPGILCYNSGDGVGVSSSGGVTGVYGLSRGSNADSAGVYGESWDSSGVGVHGNCSRGDGVYGESFYGNGVYGRTYTGYGVYGESNSGYAGYFQGPTNYFSGKVGIGTTSPLYKLEVTGSSSNTMIEGYNAGSGEGVHGRSTSGIGVYGSSSSSGTGVQGSNSNPNGWAGVFYGRVSIDGDLGISGICTKGGGYFKIDHPLDPENKFLHHSFVESPDMMNIYNGNVTLDEKGQAVVQLPEYFEALNRDFRYQLTCIGGFATVYIAEKISENHFKIAGGKPGMEVSWQVTGIRQDPYAVANSLQVEEDKPTEERGYYLHPKAYGFTEEKGIERLHNPEPIEQAKGIEQCNPII